MAELVLTEKEKSTSDLMDWDDAAIANTVRFLERNFWTVKEGDTAAFSHTTAGALLISSIIKANATKLILDVKDVSIKGQPHGDFQIKIQQVSKPKTSSLPAPAANGKRRSAGFEIAADVPTWRERFGTAWAMIRSAISTLCAGKFSLLIRKDYKIHKLTQSGPNL